MLSHQCVRERCKNVSAYVRRVLLRGEGSGAFGSSRVYDKVDGSTCHQCRQKTLGARTSCSQCHSHVACSPRPPCPLLGTLLLLLSDSPILAVRLNLSGPTLQCLAVEAALPLSLHATFAAHLCTGSHGDRKACYCRMGL